MPADFVFVSGDSGPVVTDTLTFSDGTIPDLTSATITPLVRSLTTNTIVQGLSAAVTVTDLATGAIQWAPTSADTALLPIGNVMLKWYVVYSAGQIQTFPTSGYLWGTVEATLSAKPQALVSVPDVKDYINANGGNIDRSHDDKLLRFIYAATPIIESIIGPVITRTFEEWHDGGNDLIELNHTPSFALGTNPVMRLVAASEYRGPIEYPLQIVASPTFGSIYSVFLDREMGSITRRTAGGRTIAFMPGRNTVHVVYQAGQETIPPNVQEATLEAIRQHYMTTQATGRGSLTDADSFDSPMATGFGMVVDRIARQSLLPMRSAPSFA